MKTSIYLFISILVIFMQEPKAQATIELPITIENAEIEWEGDEKSFYSEVWQTPVVTNVSKPSMMVFTPQEIKSDVAVIICPGGGQYAHSIASEGTQVAQWLNDQGIMAFVLKYRLVPTGEDGTKEIMIDGSQVEVNARKLLVLSTSDAQHAMKYVRDNAEVYNIDPTKVGLMGFSAGGAVTMNTTYTSVEEEKPDFIAPIYPWMIVVDKGTVPVRKIPMFVACASDDPLLLAPASVQLYQDWVKEGQQSELHMYAKGGHGFGMRDQGLPSDEWIKHFGNWLLETYPSD